MTTSTAQTVPGPQIHVLLRLCLVLCMTLPGIAFAQSNGRGYDDGYSPPAGFEARTGLPPVAGAADPRDAGPRIVQALRDATRFCEAIRDRSYHVDCLSERLDFVAGQLPQNGPYVETRRVLMDSAERLRAVARKHSDPAKPPVRVSSGGPRPQTATRPLTPVRAERRAAANAEARAIIEETETVLLRSSAGNPAVAEQVRGIAAAVGSNKVLLRSG